MNIHNTKLPPLPKLPMKDPAAAHKILNDYGKACARAAVAADRKRNDNWRHAVMCAISHNDYETDAPRRVQQALRLLSDAFHGLPFRESIIDDLIADRQRRGEPVGEIRPDDQSDDEVWAEIWAELPPGTKLYAEPVQKAQKECSKDAERSEPEGWQLVPKELIDFLDAKEHHLPVEDRHVLSIMLEAAPKFGEEDG